MDKLIPVLVPSMGIGGTIAIILVMKGYELRKPKEETESKGNGAFVTPACEAENLSDIIRLIAEAQARQAETQARQTEILNRMQVDGAITRAIVERLEKKG